VASCWGESRARSPLSLHRKSEAEWYKEGKADGHGQKGRQKKALKARLAGEKVKYGFPTTTARKDHLASKKKKGRQGRAPTGKRWSRGTGSPHIAGTGKRVSLLSINPDEGEARGILIFKSMVHLFTANTESHWTRSRERNRSEARESEKQRSRSYREGTEYRLEKEEPHRDLRARVKKMYQIMRGDVSEERESVSSVSTRRMPERSCSSSKEKTSLHDLGVGKGENVE